MRTRKPRRKSRRMHNTSAKKMNRALAYVKAGGRCHWCKRELSESDATLEHIEPLGAGGDDHLDNMSIACADCQRLNIPEVWI